MGVCVGGVYVWFVYVCELMIVMIVVQEDDHGCRIDDDDYY